MQPEDVDAVSRLEQQCFSDPWSRAQLEEELENPDACWLTAIEGDQVLGYMGIRLMGPEADVMQVAVAPQARRQGIARRLVQAMLEQCAGRGVERLMLEVRESNQPARRLYEEMGFIEEGRRKKYYRQPVEDAVLMSWWKKGVG